MVSFFLKEVHPLGQKVPKQVRSTFFARFFFDNYNFQKNQKTSATFDELSVDGFIKYSGSL